VLFFCPHSVPVNEFLPIAEALVIRGDFEPEFLLGSKVGDGAIERLAQSGIRAERFGVPGTGTAADSKTRRPVTRSKPLPGCVRFWVRFLKSVLKLLRIRRWATALLGDDGRDYIKVRRR